MNPEASSLGTEEDFAMSRRCELTAKGPQVGHKVSHSNIKTKRRFLPNLCNVTFISDALGRNVRLRVSSNGSMLKSFEWPGRKTRLFCFEVLSCARALPRDRPCEWLRS